MNKPVKKLNGRNCHGMCGERYYSTWSNMKQRCGNKNNTAYKNYGGRGITVCERWNIFENFWEDMKEGYSDELQIDRIDNNKGYSKENCRWATSQEQSLNTRKTRMIKYNGETKPLRVWSKISGINVNTIRARISRGTDESNYFKKKFEPKNLVKIEYNGIIKTVKDWSKETGIEEVAIRRRLFNGWTPKSILYTPVKKYKTKNI